MPIDIATGIVLSTMWISISYALKETIREEPILGWIPLFAIFATGAILDSGLSG